MMTDDDLDGLNCPKGVAMAGMISVGLVLGIAHLLWNLLP